MLTRTTSYLLAVAVCAGGSVFAADQAAPLAQFDRLLGQTKYVEAEALAKKLVAAEPRSASVRCRVAALHAARGRYDKAIKELDTAIAIEFKRMEPRAVRAELLELLGRHEQATKAADAVIEFYNANPKTVTGPREQVAVGRALALANAPKDALRLLTRAQRAEKGTHLATLALGALFLLKGQVTDASGEFNTVLRADKRHPGALIGLAQCAFSIGKLEDAETHAKAALAAAPNSVDARDLLAAMAAIDDKYAEAEGHIAKSLAVNPNGIAARAILAGCHLVRGRREAYLGEEARVRKLNPRCDKFYTWVGAACARKRRMTLAEQMFRTAIKLNPEAYDAMAELGRHLFRQAKYDEAKELLDASHRIDGFNVRTFNSLNLLDRMEKYRAVKGASVIVRFEDDPDGLLAEYVKRHAERSLDELSKIYGYRPTQAIVVEVLPTQRYFSARVVGLPHVGAIGVCFGNVVAFTSPREQRGRVNWRETLRHELTHVVTLLGTDFRIPHWLTEGMAVHEQGSDRPYAWDVLLKTSARLGRIIPLGELTRGFTRPKTGEQRMLAYCQSEVALDFFIRSGGARCLPALMKAFREGKELPEAVQAVTGRPLAAFEKDCLAYVRRVADGLPVLPRITRRDEKAVLDLAARQPDDAGAQCNLAILLASRRKTGPALKAVGAALKADPKCAEAHYIRARVLMIGRKEAEAAKAAKRAAELNLKFAPAQFLLGQLAEKRGDNAEAVRRYRLAMEAHPSFPKPYAALAALYKKRKDDARMAAVLERRVRHSSNALAECVELGRHYLSKGRWADAARVAEVAIGIGPFYAEPHCIAGQALWEQGQAGRAVTEMEVAVLCAGREIKAMEGVYPRLVRAGRKQQAAQVEKRLDALRGDAAANNLRLARAYLKAGEKGKARTAALAALELDPNSDAVKAFIQGLK